MTFIEYSPFVRGGIHRSIATIDSRLYNFENPTRVAFFDGSADKKAIVFCASVMKVISMGLKKKHRSLWKNTYFSS